MEFVKVKKEKSKNRKEKIVAKNNSANSQESRRTFINMLWKGLSIIVAVEFSAVFFGFIFSWKRSEKSYIPKQLIEAGDVNSFKLNSVTVFRSGRFYFTRLVDSSFIALSLRCTHLGCSIEWEEKKKRFICPYYSSAFAMNDDVKNPPAPIALNYYPIIIENGIIKVDVGTKIQRDRFSKEQLVYV